MAIIFGRECAVVSKFCDVNDKVVSDAELLMNETLESFAADVAEFPAESWNFYHSCLYWYRVSFCLYSCNSGITNSRYVLVRWSICETNKCMLRYATACQSVPVVLIWFLICTSLEWP